MKKLLASLLVIGIALSTCAFAEEIKQITKETIFYVKATHTVPENAFKNFSVLNTENSSQMQEQLISFLKSCQPYNENINVNLFGFDATLNIHSNGKVNEKCTYEFSGKVNKIPQEIATSVNMQTSDLLSLNPKVNCEFTQEQLDALVEALSEVISEFKTENISKSQAKQNLKNKLANDEKLKALFKDSNACAITGLTGQNL